MNKPIFYTSLMYQLLCQMYFGWDFKITSELELLCAGFAFLMLALAFLPEEDTCYRPMDTNEPEDTHL